MNKKPFSLFKNLRRKISLCRLCKVSGSVLWCAGNGKMFTWTTELLGWSENASVVSGPTTFTWLGASGCSCHPCIPPCPQEEKTKHPCPVQPLPNTEFKGHLFWHGAALHPPIPIQERVARVWEGWRLLNGGEEMDQEKDTERKTKCRFQCSHTVIMEVWSGSETAGSPGYSDTPAAKQAQPPEFLGGILVWEELRFTALRLSGLCLRDVCMSKLHPNHTALSKESGFLLNAGEHRGSQDTISQVSTTAGNVTSIYVMKTETITICNQTLCILGCGCQMF